VPKIIENPACGFFGKMSWAEDARHGGLDFHQEI
jgi:hypothetical protein